MSVPLPVSMRADQPIQISHTQVRTTTVPAQPWNPTAAALASQLSTCLAHAPPPPEPAPVINPALTLHEIAVCNLAVALGERNPTTASLCEPDVVTVHPIGDHPNPDAEICHRRDREERMSGSEHTETDSPPANRQRTCAEFQAASDPLPPATAMDFDMADEGEEFADDPMDVHSLYWDSCTDGMITD